MLEHEWPGILMITWRPVHLLDIKTLASGGEWIYDKKIGFQKVFTIVSSLSNTKWTQFRKK